MIIDRTTLTGCRVLDWPGDPRDDALALRLCGGLNQIVLMGADHKLAKHYPPNRIDKETIASLLKKAIARHDGFLVESLKSSPQTNEIARSAMIYPGLLAISRKMGLPLHINEIGSSAGLNLLLDRFSYDYENQKAGLFGSPVRLAPALRGYAPPLTGDLTILSRAGSDVAPINLSDERALLKLRSYVWPDQATRLQRLDAAIALAKRHPCSIERADAVDFLDRRLAARPQDGVFVLFHSIVWQYLSSEAKQRIVSSLDRAGSEATASKPLAWLRMEPADTRDDFATLSLTTWPGGDSRHLARCDYHGRWVEWIDESELIQASDLP